MSLRLVIKVIALLLIGTMIHITKSFFFQFQVLVHLSNDILVEARFLFYNNHYKVALLQIETEQLLVQASFGCRPQYEQEVFVLGRKDNYRLVVTHTSILRRERQFGGRIHYMFCTDDSPVVKYIVSCSVFWFVSVFNSVFHSD